MLLALHRTVRSVRYRPLPVVILAVVLATAPEAATPIYHGQIAVGGAGGRVDPTTGRATFSVLRWELTLTQESNGMDPAAEPVIIAVGEENFLLPAGSLRRSRGGRRFSYRRNTDRGVRSIQLSRMHAGVWRVRFTLAGVELSSLLVLDPPVCLPFAVIVGDDDRFSGISFDRPKPFPSSVLTIPWVCTDVVGWPWA